MMKLIKLILKMIGFIYGMLFTGENIKNIKSTCQVEYANYLHDIQDIEKAIKYYNKAISSNANNYYAYGSLAAALFEKKQFRQALEYCKKAGSIKPSGISVKILSFVIYDILDEANLAKEVLQYILKFYENDLIAGYDRLAYTYYQVGMHKKAEHYCKEALKINPSVWSLHFNLGKIYFVDSVRKPILGMNLYAYVCD
jgi:tetratricopeptide (TPR) repeat protein